MTRIALFGAAIAALAAASASAQPAAPAAPAAPAQGPITRAQMEAGVQQRFAQMDANHDGFVTADEMVGAGGDTQRAAAMMQRMDSNHDGKLSLAELTASRLAAFDAADTNHDGILTPEERAAAMARMQTPAPAPATPH
jgi:Ca2+-binding EF-hand superfamily protein